MTIKEIAALCGMASDQTVKNWIHKIADDPAKNWQGLAIKLAEAEKSGKEAADFTLEETLAIIGEGGGNKTLAALLAENAANKDQLVVYNNRHTGLRDEIEAIIDKKIQAAFQEIGQKLDEMRNLMVIPASATDKSLENIMRFIENHVVFTGNHYEYEKQCEVWALFKEVTPDHGKMGDFITRFCTIYGQDRDFKVKNVRVFSGLRLKDTRGVCSNA